MNYIKKVFSSYWGISLICILITGIILSAKTILDIDVGFHLRGGEWILQNMQFHKFDVFTYTVNQNEYIAIHWLYQVLIFLIYQAFSYIGLSIFNIILTFLVFLCLIYIFKINNVNPLNISVCLLIFIIGSEFRFVFRPEIITWIFTLMTLIIMELYYREKKNLIFLLPIIFMLWVNLHGLYYIGIFIVFTYLISIFTHKKYFDKKLFLWGIFSVLALLINPYFLKGITFPFYLATRLENSNIFKNIISELKSPFSIGFTKDSLFPIVSLITFYICIVLSAVSVLINFRNLKLHHYLILFFTFYLAYSSIRNVPIFIIIAVIITGISFNKITKSFLIYEKYISVALIVICLLFSIRIINGNYYASDNRVDEFGFGLNENLKPINTGDFLIANNLNGRIMNDILSGSWLEWQTKYPVFIDGRLEVMKENFATEYGESLRNDRTFYNVLDKYNIQLLAFNYSLAQNWLTYILKDSSYRLVHFDDVDCVFLKTGYRDDIPTFDFNSAGNYIDYPNEIYLSKIEDILIKKKSEPVIKWVKGFISPANYSEVIKDANMGYFLMRCSQPFKAEPYCLRALSNAKYNLENIYLLLGAIYLDENKPDKAYYSLNRVLEENPDNSTAKVLLSKIRLNKK